MNLSVQRPHRHNASLLWDWLRFFREIDVPGKTIDETITASGDAAICFLGEARHDDVFGYAGVIHPHPTVMLIRFW